MLIIISRALVRGNRREIRLVLILLSKGASHGNGESRSDIINSSELSEINLTDVIARLEARVRSRLRGTSR